MINDPRLNYSVIWPNEAKKADYLVSSKDASFIEKTKKIISW